MRQLQQQHHALVGPHRQWEKDSALAWLIAQGLQPAVSVTHCQGLHFIWRIVVQGTHCHSQLAAHSM